MYGYFAYDRERPLKFAFSAHVVEVLAEQVGDDDALLRLDEVALDLGHALHVGDLLENLEFIRDC